MHFPAIDYRARRQRIMEQIGIENVLILFANPEQQRSHDTLFPYRQHSDILYTCGFEEPECVVVLAPGHDTPFVMFVRERDREKEVWTGYRAGTEGAIADYGADAAYTLEQLDVEMPHLLAGRDILFHNLGVSNADDARVMRWMRALGPTRHAGDLSPHAIGGAHKILHGMRMFKDSGELARMREAASLSAKAHLLAMQSTRPGQWEYELAALFTQTFLQAGASGHAYDPIVAGGEQACVLHYTANDRQLHDGDLVLIDAGAEWGHYAGDITRTWPVGKTFSGPQRAVYDAVLDAQLYAISLTVPGNSNVFVHDATVRKLTENMIDIGLLNASIDEAIEHELYREYYMHGTGHYLGIDVHDVGVYRRRDGSPFVYEDGMVITIEPGLYIRPDSDAPEAFRGIGVRIEDDVVIRDATQYDAPEILTAEVPKDPTKIEEMRTKAWE